MKKRTISLLLALCMVFSMAMPAFAVETDSTAIEPPAVTQDDTTMPEELPSEEIIGTPEEIVEAPDEVTAMPEETADASEEDVTTPEDSAQASDETSEPSVEPAAPEVSTEEEISTLAAEPAKAPVIPGYTQVTSQNLKLDKYYMLVSTDSQGNLYAFYPAADHANDDPGNTIDANRFAAGAFVAQLNVNSADNSITATWLKDNSTALNMEQLLFTVQRSNGYSFKANNGLYIAITTKMLASESTTLGVSLSDHNAFTITNGNRILSFNKPGEDTEFRPGNGFTTNFWAPGSTTGQPIYLYTKDGAEAPVEADKTALKQEIAKAEQLKDNTVYTEESRNALVTALTAAKAENDKSDSTFASVEEATQKLVRTMQAMKPVADKIAAGAPANGTTKDEPFPKGTGTSQTFRIPAITTLNDGTIAAAIDARWDNSPDGDNIDTLFSTSTDNGKTWNYTFPNFFNDSVNKRHDLSSAFLDPVMVQGNDGTIYLMTDLFPAGTYIGSVSASTGYELIGDKQRLVLYTTPINNQNSNNYAYYVGDFGTADAKGKAFAPVIAKGDDTLTPAYYVDEHYYLYTADKAPMYCPQLDSDKFVEQNVFFYNADLHVRNATYLWLITSKDNGKTWSAPTIMNPLIRPDKETGMTHRFYGVGPGAGLALKDGTVMLTCYINDTRTPEKSSFIYTRDQGKTWHRSQTATTGGDWSSESTLVQIDDTTVRQFCRDNYSVLRYTDHVWNGTDWVRKGDPVRLDNVPKTAYNQLSAIRYSKPINGKPAILVSTATMPNRHRTRGMIYTFTLNDDNTMELIGSYQLTKPGTSTVEPGVVYGYSSLTELSDGSIGLLYEQTFKDSKYINLSIEALAPGAIVDGKRSIEVPLYGTYEVTYSSLPTEEELKALDTSVVTAKIDGSKVIFTGIAEGTTSFSSNGVTTTIKVVSTYPTLPVNIPCTGEYQMTVGANPQIVNNNTNITTTLDPIIVTGGQGVTGTNKNFTGETEALATALYTFHQVENGFEVSAPTADGTMTWLDVTQPNGFPFSTQAASVEVISSGENTFYLRHGDKRYLYFWPNRNDQYSYDGVDRTSGFEAGCTFKLYRPADQNETSSTEIPGYVPVSKPEDGGTYLIVSEANGIRFAMRPSTDGGNRYSHVLMVKPDLPQIPTTVANTLTLHAHGGAAIANVLVDGTVYQLNMEHHLTRVEQVDSTESTTGCKLHWHCDLCNHDFLDADGMKPATDKDLVIPAGTPLVPLDPSTPVPETPDIPLTPLEPSDPINPDQPGNNTPAENPATGDSANLGLWVVVFVLAGVGVGVIIYFKRKGDK